MSKYKTILYDKKERIAKITLNRPENLNRINQAAYHELKEVLNDVVEDDDVRVLVITGAGDEIFSSGADIIDMMTDEETTPLTFREMIDKGHELYSIIENLPKPVIAMVQAKAVYGGCELIQACDFVIASDEAIFHQAEITSGIIPCWGGTQRLPRLIGWRKALELILTGDTIDAQEAERLGLINRAVPHERLEQEVVALAKKLMEKGPVALQMAKAAVKMAMNTTMEQGLAYEAEVGSLAIAAENFREYNRARVEGRAPVFKKEKRLKHGEAWG